MTADGAQALESLVGLRRGISWDAAMERRGPEPGTYPVLRIPNVQDRLARSVQGSTGLKNLSEGTIRELRLRLPHVPEQRRIAEILDTLDTAIRKTEEVIAKLQQVKQGLLHDLLTRGIDENGGLRDPERHPEQFEESALGRIPKPWEAKRLGDVGTVCNGTTPSRARPEYWTDGTVPWLSSGKANDYRVQTPSEMITDRALQECSLRLLPRGTVIVGMIGQGKTRGMSARLEIEAAINQNVAAIVPGESFDGVFAHLYLHRHYERLRSGARGSNQDALNCALVAAFPVAVPPLTEQQRIASTMTSFERRVEQEEQAATKLRSLRHGLLHDLLTGRVRVRVDGEDAG